MSPVSVSTSPVSVSTTELYARLGTASAPMLVDVRRQDAFDTDDKQIIGAVRHAPGEIDRWSRELPAGGTVVLYCSHGGDVSQGAASMTRFTWCRKALGAAAAQPLKAQARTTTALRHAISFDPVGQR